MILKRVIRYIKLRPKPGWSFFSFVVIMTLISSVNFEIKQSSRDFENFKEFKMVEVKLNRPQPRPDIAESDVMDEAEPEQKEEEDLSFGEDTGDFATPDEGMTPPRPLFSRLPRYPDSMRQRSIEGVVIVELGIDKSGNVVFGRIVESLDREFDEVVLRWARDIRFYPARDESRRAVNCRIRLPIRFTLDN